MKASKPASRILGLVNLKGIALLAAVLTVCDLAVAYGLSPLMTDWAVRSVNRYTSSKIVIQNLRLHPVILTLTAKSIEAADPDDNARRMFLADSFRATLDPVELLTGRVSLGTLQFKQVELVLVKDAQGTFNIEKLMKKEPADKGSQEWASGVKDWFKQKTGGQKDWFGDAYDKAKKWVRKPSDAKDKSEKTREVREEPRGRVVSFNAAEDPIFKIGSVHIHGGRLVLTDKSGTLPPLEDLNFELTSFVLRRAGGFDFAGIRTAGTLRGEREGSFDLELNRSGGRIRSRIQTRHLDLSPLRPLYEDSSPVVFDRGLLTLDCRTELTAAAIDSHNDLKLEDYSMRSTTDAKLGPVPASLVVDALNRRKELELRFNITGDPDRPSMNGFETTLWNLVKDDLGSQALQTLESKTGVSLSGLSEKLKKLF